MAKRRKRRRMAFIEKMNQIQKENPTMTIERVKTITEVEVKKALRIADHKEPYDREEHHRVFRDTLLNDTTDTARPTTTTATTTTVTKAKPKTSTTTTKPKTSTTKTTTKRTKKPTTATKKQTVTKRTKKAT